LNGVKAGVKLSNFYVQLFIVGRNCAEIRGVKVRLGEFFGLLTEIIFCIALGALVLYSRFGRAQRQAASKEKKRDYKAPDSAQDILKANKMQKDPFQRKKRVKIQQKLGDTLIAKQKDGDIKKSSRGRPLKKKEIWTPTPSSPSYGNTNAKTVDKKTDNVANQSAPLYPPVVLIWQNNSCFIDSLLQCLISNAHYREMIDNDSTWDAYVENTAFHEVATTIGIVTSLWDKLDQVGVCGPFVIEDEGLRLLRGANETVCTSVLCPSIITMMQMYSDRCKDQIHREYQFGGIGDPIEFLSFIVGEIFDEGKNFNHPFVKSVTMASHRRSDHWCRKCESLLDPSFHSSYEVDGLYLKLLTASQTDDRNIPQKIKDFLSHRNETLQGDQMKTCNQCKQLVQEVDSIQHFVRFPIDEVKILIICVLEIIESHSDTADDENGLHHILSSSDMHFDFTPFVLSAAGETYSASLTGYIALSKDNKKHFLSVTRGRKGDEFYQCDDLKKTDVPRLLTDLPESDRGIPAYLFYSIDAKGPSEKKTDEVNESEKSGELGEFTVSAVTSRVLVGFA
jgi:hypothetical protein